MIGEAGVRAGAVAGVAAVSGAMCWLLLSVWGQGGRELPQLPWVGVLPLLLVAVAVVLAGWQVRSYTRSADVVSAGRRRVAPQRARGTLVAAQSAALGGAVLLGWYVGNALMHLPDSDVVSVRLLLLRAAVSAGAALLLTLAGLLAQAWCRIPPGDDDEDDRRDQDPGEVAYG
ncbi:MAG: DUF3180 domain-containing protein [Actinomycetota bacterium]|nr:DUF3180 domain-containing protein [Actinomycetota bacterium]